MAGVAVGDEVSVIPSFSMNQYFTYGEVIVAPDYAVVKHPKSLTFAEAASVWMMFVTAYGALIEDAKVTQGDFVIIPAASSSVGLAAIQIANYAGASSIALTRSSAKRAQLLEAGAAHVIATEEEDLLQEVKRITGGRGARVVFDPIGGPNFSKLISALAFQGIAYIYGALAEGENYHPRAGNDRQDGDHQGPQRLADERRRSAAQGCRGIRAQGPGGWRAQAGHR